MNDFDKVSIERFYWRSPIRFNQIGNDKFWQRILGTSYELMLVNMERCNQAAIKQSFFHIRLPRNTVPDRVRLIGGKGTYHQTFRLLRFTSGFNPCWFTLQPRITRTKNAPVNDSKTQFLVISLRRNVTKSYFLCYFSMKKMKIKR
jgi:hypothetical protein